MAWMRMMGAESVAYHRKHRARARRRLSGHGAGLLRVPGRDPAALGRHRRGALGLDGPVPPEAYEAIYGPGGARHPAQRGAAGDGPPAGHGAGDLGAQERGRVGGDRPGRGHASDHGRRARRHPGLPGPGDPPGGRPARSDGHARPRPAGWSTPTPATPPPGPGILARTIMCCWPTWSRCATSRGGWKAADTALWREHLHAATMVGRVAAARVAVELGYGIEADPGPSGRLRHWRIAGVPDEVIDVHSKRAAEIDAECQRRGEHSSRARAVAARTTRQAKEHGVEGELVGRWRAELAADRLAGRAARPRRSTPPPASSGRRRNCR